MSKLSLVAACLLSTAVAGLGCGSGSHGGGSGGTGSGPGGTTGGAGTGSTGGVGFGSRCDSTAVPDPCAPLGYACTIDDSAGDAACDLPGEFGACLAAVGCAASGTTALQCTAGFLDADGGAEAICLVPCTGGDSSVCLDPSTNCVHLGATSPPGDVCGEDPCGPSVQPATAAYSPCDSAGTGDGECLTFGGGSVGLCYQDGTAALGDSCSFDRGDATDPLCAFGGICIGGQLSSLCLPLCDLGTGAPCPTGEYCVSPDSSGQADWGVCLQPCMTATDCTPPLTCSVIDSSEDAACVPE